MRREDLVDRGVGRRAGARPQLPLHPGPAGRRQDDHRRAPDRRTCCAQGKRVGVTSNSHKVINNLLRAVEKRAEEERFPFSRRQEVAKRGRRKRVRRQAHPRRLRRTPTSIDSGAPLIAGTAWLFADAAARSVARLSLRRRGGPGVARQPRRHGRPLRATSCCWATRCSSGSRSRACIRGDRASRRSSTCSTDRRRSRRTAASSCRTTWRMHEDVCRFISDAVYDGRLAPTTRTSTSASC